MYRPVSYLQTDARWKYISYSAKGESTTIGASGCGPTAMSMVLATWADPTVNPQTECAWALAHGYKAPHSGTYYGYFVPAAKRYGLTARQLNGANIYGNSKSAYHDQAKKAIEDGHLVIACMGKGLWTSSGHYVLVYDIKGNTIYINDPASTKLARTQGDYSLFRQQVKYYWVIEKPRVSEPKKDPEVEKVDIDKFVNDCTNEQAYLLMCKAFKYMGNQTEPEWSMREGYWRMASALDIVDGTRPEAPVKRDEVIVILGRLGLIDR